MPPPQEGRGTYHKVKTHKQAREERIINQGAEKTAHTSRNKTERLGCDANPEGDTALVASGVGSLGRVFIPLPQGRRGPKDKNSQAPCEVGKPVNGATKLHQRSVGTRAKPKPRVPP